MPLAKVTDFELRVTTLMCFITRDTNQW